MIKKSKEIIWSYFIRKGQSVASKPGDDSKTPGKSNSQLKLFKRIMISSVSTKPKLKIKPTQEEMKDILDKICYELKILGFYSVKE